MTLDDSALAMQSSPPLAGAPQLLVPAVQPQSATAFAATASEPSYEYPYGPPFEYQPPRGRFATMLSRFAERAPWASPAGIGLVVAAAISYTLVLHPRSDAPSTCLLHILTGFDCPGCGGTRAAWSLLHGDLPAAARFHAPFVFAVPFLLYMYVSYTVRRVTRWRMPRLVLGPRVLMAFMVVWVVYTVARNLPWAPFTSLYV